MSDLRKKIIEAVNSECAEKTSNTPDWILAQYLISCLDAFDTGVKQRERWYDRDVWPQKEVIKRKPHREICSLCHEISRVGFWVPNTIWKLAVHHSQIEDLVCLRCFTRLADERQVEWDKCIKFYPVSQITHLTLESLAAQP